MRLAAVTAVIAMFISTIAFASTESRCRERLSAAGWNVVLSHRFHEVNLAVVGGCLAFTGGAGTLPCLGQAVKDIASTIGWSLLGDAIRNREKIVVSNDMQAQVGICSGTYPIALGAKGTDHYVYARYRRTPDPAPTFPKPSSSSVKIFIHAPNGDFHQAHSDEIINYIDWSGNKWTAKIRGNSFLHAPDNNFNHPDTHPDEIINYIDWSHNKWTAKIRGNSFLHAPDNNFNHPDTHPDEIINYIDWSHNKWTAKIQ